MSSNEYEENTLDYESEENQTSSDDEAEMVLERWKRTKSKKRGRRSTWSDESISDLVDIIASSERYKTKLIYENTQRKANTVLYSDIQKLLCDRAANRGENFEVDVIQIRNKFKL